MQDTVFFSYGKHPQDARPGTDRQEQRGARSGPDHAQRAGLHDLGCAAGDLEPEHLGAPGNPAGRLSGEDRAPAGHGDRGEGEFEVAGCAARDACERAPAGVPVVTVADRESDFFEFLTQAEGAAREVSDPRAHRSQARARRQRGLRPDARGARATRPLWAAMTVEVPGNGRRKARTASHRGARCRSDDPAAAAPRRARQGVRFERTGDRDAGRRDRAIPPRGERVDQLGAADESARQRLRVRHREGAVVRQDAGASRFGTRCSSPAARSRTACSRRPSA